MPRTSPIRQETTGCMISNDLVLVRLPWLLGSDHFRSFRSRYWSWYGSCCLKCIHCAGCLGFPEVQLLSPRRCHSISPSSVDGGLTCSRSGYHSHPVSEEVRRAAASGLCLDDPLSGWLPHVAATGRAAQIATCKWAHGPLAPGWPSGWSSHGLMAAIGICGSRWGTMKIPWSYVSYEAPLLVIEALFATNTHQQTQRA